MYKHLFGPVPSRRLGMSLGVDLVPHKTCPLDCVYCECGPSDQQSMARKPYVSAAEVTTELDEFLQENSELDFLTFSGGGEPTANSDIGEVLNHIKNKYPAYKVCLLTNGLFLDEKLSNELKNLDLIVPSLDASLENDFQIINRPPPEYKLNDLIKNLVNFRKIAPKVEFHLEIFIIPNVNDSPEALMKFSEIVKEIQPDKIQLNTLDRPGSENWVEAASPETCEAFKRALENIAPVQVTGKFVKKTSKSPKSEAKHFLKERITDMISRRPCTTDDLSAALNADEKEIEGILAKLANSGKITCEIRERGNFYRALHS